MMTIENGSDSRSFHWASASRPALPRRQLSLVPSSGSCCSSFRKRHRHSSGGEPSPWRRNSENILTTISGSIDADNDDPRHSLYSLLARGEDAAGTLQDEEYSPEAEVARHVRQFLSRTLFPPSVPPECTSPPLMGYSSLYERLRKPVVQSTANLECRLIHESYEQSPSVERISRPQKQRILRKRNSEDDCVDRVEDSKPPPGRRKAVSEPGTPSYSPSSEVRQTSRLSSHLYGEDINSNSYGSFSPRCFIHIYLPDEVPSKD